MTPNDGVLGKIEIRLENIVLRDLSKLRILSVTFVDFDLHETKSPKTTMFCAHCKMCWTNRVARLKMFGRTFLKLCKFWRRKPSGPIIWQIVKSKENRVKKYCFGCFRYNVIFGDFDFNFVDFDLCKVISPKTVLFWAFSKSRQKMLFWAILPKSPQITLFCVILKSR